MSGIKTGGQDGIKTGGPAGIKTGGPTRIKICGLMRKEDIYAVNAYLPEYAGFVFAGKSRRYVDKETALELRKELDDRIKAAGVFVDEDISVIADSVKRKIIDIVQLHGNEDEEYIRRLKEIINVPVIKAFGISGRDDLVKAMNCGADLILLDNKTAGSGEAFDWSLLSGCERPFFLAGGLGTENVSAAVKEIRPFAVDVSSGVETDGRKDPRKIEEFIKTVRKTDSEITNIERGKR